MQSAEPLKKNILRFPIAVDGDWAALKRWWLTKDRDFTSVSFLVDRSGIIRYVHPGGEFHDGQQGGTPVHESAIATCASLSVRSRSC
ncbi:MAG: hypothetical protein ACJ74Z_20205 [Bryobacteraceae bacterium]